jgi:hypothetical protein
MNIGTVPRKNIGTMCFAKVASASIDDSCRQYGRWRLFPSALLRGCFAKVASTSPNLGSPDADLFTEFRPQALDFG